MAVLALLALGAAFSLQRPEIHLTNATAAVCYEGWVGAGQRLRRVIVDASHPRAATMHLLSRPARTRSLTRVDAERLVATDGSIVVSLVADAARLTMFTARDTTHATLRRTERASDVAGVAGVAGEWEAAIGPGGVIRLRARLAAGPCGLLVGTFDSPDQGQHDLPLTAGRVLGDSVVLEAEYIGLRITLPARGANERRAVMTQHGVQSEIVMRRGWSGRRPQEPVRPYPYVEHEVRFPSHAPDVRVAGTLTVPTGPGPHPAVIFISGSGAQDRDETVAGHRPFLVLADRLTRLGYAVLRTDDRGVGATSGHPLMTGLNDVADDVRGAMDFLRARPEIQRTRIGLLGHSEGGYVAPIVAATDSSVAFLLLLGGPAVTGRDLLAAQRSMLARASGDAPHRVRLDSLVLDRIFAVLDTRPDDARLESAVDSALAVWLAGLAPAERTAVSEMLAERTASQDSLSLVLWKSRWFKSLYHHDPAPELRRLTVPVFALIGELDLQVPSGQNIAAFESLFAGSRRGQLTLHRVPGINHMLQRAKTGRMEEYMTIEETIAPDVLVRIDEWLTRVVPITATIK